MARLSLLFSVFLPIFFFAQVHAINYCGTSWAEASKCTKQCSTGKDFQCLPEKCWADVECTNNPSSPSISNSSSSSASTGTPDGPAKEGEDKSRLWEWLGPVIGAVSSIIAALIGVYCVKKKKESAGQHNIEAPTAF